MQIQQVEKQTGIPAQSIRFYEREGLITPERNPDNRYRDYSQADVQRLKTISFCRSMGIPIGSIRKLLNEETSFKSCVEDALLEATATEMAAGQTAALCRAVLEKLEVRPNLTPGDCAGAVLSNPETKRLYEQVLPRESRKPAAKRLWLFWLPASFAALVGFLLLLSICSVAGFRTQRSGILDWVIDRDTVMTFSYGETEVSRNSEQGRYLKIRLEDLLLEPMPSQALPGFQRGDQAVTVTMTRGDETAVLRLEMLKNGVGLEWNAPKKHIRRTILNRGCKTMLRQMQEWITP